jgi:TIR domain-containing protein/pentapeptide repeat protein
MASSRSATLTHHEASTWPWIDRDEGSRLPANVRRFVHQRFENRRLDVGELRAEYEKGERRFWGAILDNLDLRGLNLRGASLLGASLKGAKLDGLDLTHAQLKAANLTGATLQGAELVATDLIGATFVGADLRNVDLTGASLTRADCTDADMRESWFNVTTLEDIRLVRTRLDKINISGANFGDVDVRPFCDARGVTHSRPSSVDARTVVRSYQHPGLKRFMVDCGVPAIFAEYMIDCARALQEPSLRSMMQSTFISYGGPDERFARRLYDALREHQVMVFFFPVNARVGERIDTEVFRNLQEHDRIILVCSRASLNRPGVLNEVQETFDREARDGGATYLLPIMLDDYVLTEWKESQPALAERVNRRVVADFRNTIRSRKKFDSALSRLVDVLKKSRPTTG